MKAVRRAFRSTAAKCVGVFAVLVLVVAIVPGASRGSVSSQANSKRAAFKDVVVSLSGRIGPINGSYLRIGRSTEAAVRRAEKRKADWRGEIVVKSAVAWGLEYDMRIAGSKKNCERDYKFSFVDHRLSDFSSNCSYLKTTRGIRVGMAAMKAEGLAGRTTEYEPRFSRACAIEGYAITEQGGKNWIAIWMKTLSSFSTIHYGPVVNIQLVGTYSSLWEACESATTS